MPCPETPTRPWQLPLPAPAGPMSAFGGRIGRRPCPVSELRGTPSGRRPLWPPPRHAASETAARTRRRPAAPASRNRGPGAARRQRHPAAPAPRPARSPSSASPPGVARVADSHPSASSTSNLPSRCPPTRPRPTRTTGISASTYQTRGLEWPARKRCDSCRNHAPGLRGLSIKSRRLAVSVALSSFLRALFPTPRRVPSAAGRGAYPNPDPQLCRTVLAEFCGR
jgi:hypothetical protein